MGQANTLAVPKNAVSGFIVGRNPFPALSVRINSDLFHEAVEDGVCRQFAHAQLLTLGIHIRQEVLMISNPKGWRNRRAAALVRKQEKEARASLNAQRWRAFQGLPPEPVELSEDDIDAELKKLEAESKLNDIVNQIEASTELLNEAIGEVDPETLENKELRDALEAKGFEVPKTTARGRLIELYKEKVK